MNYLTKELPKTKRNYEIPVFKSELAKIYREKTTFIVFALIFILLMVPFFLGSRHTSDNSDLFVYENNYQMAESNIEFYSSIPNPSPTELEIIESLKESSGYLKNIIDGTKENDKHKVLTNELKYEQINLDNMKNGTLVGTPIIEQEKNVAVLDFLVSENMNELENNPYEMGAINYFGALFSTSQFITISLILISVFLAYSFTLDERNKSIKIYNMSPYSMYKIYFQKFVSVYLSIIVNVGIVCLIAFSIFCFKNGLGSGHYPIPLIINNSSVQLISTFAYIIKSLIFINSWIIFLALTSLLLSLLSSNLILNMFILFLPMLLQQYNVIDNLINDEITPYLLTSYVDTSRVIMGGDGDFPLKNINITFNMGVFLLLICSLIVLFFLTLVIRNRNKNKFLF